MSKKEVYIELNFDVSAANYPDCPKHIKPEIALVGASNAGKSSLLNAISNEKQSCLIFLKLIKELSLTFLDMDFQKYLKCKKSNGQKKYLNTLIQEKI